MVDITEQLKDKELIGRFARTPDGKGYFIYDKSLGICRSYPIRQGTKRCEATKFGLLSEARGSRTPAELWDVGKPWPLALALVARRPLGNGAFVDQCLHFRWLIPAHWVVGRLCPR